MNPIIDVINEAISTLPKPTVVGILVRPADFEKLRGLLNGTVEYQLRVNYTDALEVVTHQRYQLEQAMLFSSRESMRKFLEMLDVEA